jgi:HTH-type transcriptional regulator / antitoxin HigA
MIQNERQYEVTKRQLAMLAESLAQAREYPNLAQPAVFRQAGLNGVRFLMEDLEAEIAEYEKLRAGQVPSLPLASVLDDLPTALTRARIARGWTQRDLANTLGTTEQQVQKDERGGYAKASLARLRRVAEVLGMRLSGEAQLTTCESAGSPRPTAVAGPK